MNRDEALSLAAITREIVPWADGLYASPVKPAEQEFPHEPYFVLLSSGFLHLAFYSQQDLVDLIQQLQPQIGRWGLPLIEHCFFNEWVVELLARTNLDEQEQFCGTGELEIFVRNPSNATRLLVPSKEGMAPVVDGKRLSQSEHMLAVPEVMLTVTWSCLTCNSILTVAKQIRLESEYRLFASPIHLALGTGKRCPANVWIEVNYSKQDNEEPLCVQIWQVIRRSRKLRG